MAIYKVQAAEVGRREGGGSGREVTLYVQAVTGERVREWAAGRGLVVTGLEEIEESAWPVEAGLQVVREPEPEALPEPGRWKRRMVLLGIGCALAGLAVVMFVFVWRAKEHLTR